MASKKWYMITYEGVAPVTISYRVLAENEENALEIAETRPSSLYLEKAAKPDIKHMKKKKATVKNLWTGFIELVKNF